MPIDPNIYLSRLDEFEVEGAIALEEELARRMATARRITILSAYYSTGYLRDLFSEIPFDQRRNCELTLVFGVEPVSRLIEVVGELRTWRETLATLRFAKLDIRLVTDRNPFHVKLVHLMNLNSPNWFVGSANASGAIGGNRHELMIRVRGRHPQLQAYMDAVCHGSVPLDRVKVIVPYRGTCARSFSPAISATPLSIG